MLQNLAAEFIDCYERARQAREKADRAMMRRLILRCFGQTVRDQSMCHDMC